MPTNDRIRIAAVSDLHYTKGCRGTCQEIFAQASHEADVLLLCGDLTDDGLPEEAQVLADDLHSHARIPVIAVWGNHDFESARTAEVQEILEKVGVIFLDGAATEIKGVGFAGVCGFGGGFGRQMVNAWGEPLIKAFVQESVDHALRLEKALTRLTSEKRVALLHYSPIRETVEGENLEIFPFLGSSRLEATIDQFKVSVVFHGHAHHGKMEGRTAGQIPVYNVSRPVLIKTTGKQFFVYEM
jgi:Icc-related predicted phosphoesterase